MAFVDKSRVEPIIFFIEKMSFSMKLFSGHFYGQPFIKTVRGPLKGENRTEIQTSRLKALLTLHVMTEMHFLLRKT